MGEKGIPLTQQDRDRVLRLRRETDLSLAKIAHEERLAESTVRKIVKNAIDK